MSSSYIQKVLRTQNSSFVGYWPLNEESGTVAYDLSPNGYNGTSSGLLRAATDRNKLAPDGSKCAKFDGSASYINIYSAIGSEPTTEGSLSVWAACENANLAGTTKMQIIKLAADANNFIDLTFDTTAYRFNAAYEGGGTDKNINSPLLYNVGYGAQWHHFVMTWSATNDALNFYVNGSAQTAATSLGTWAGAMASTLMVVGSSSTTAADVWNGWLAHLGIWSAILTQTEVDELYKIGL
jgi:hypothetical protein